MDSSPLMLAQSHARKASKANTPTAAIEEHELAAGQFATAAKGTDNSEAFRTLKLLEEHHTKLSQLLKSQVSIATEPVRADVVPQEKLIPTSSPSLADPQTHPTHVSTPYRPETQSFAPAHRPQRDAGSSIASNLASARGIPANKQRRAGQVSSTALAQQHAEGKILTPQRKPKASNRPTGGPVEASQLSEKVEIATQQGSGSSPGKLASDKETMSQTDTNTSVSRNDDAFNRFYNTFESLFSKLSAPLAFAGLPLTADSESAVLPSRDDTDQIQHSPTKTPNRNKAKPTTSTTTHVSARPSSRATAEPDYSRLFSPAALAAVREEPGGSNLGTAESFYVVPTTGGTMQYASILARHQNHHSSRTATAKHSPHHHRTISRDSTGLSEDLDEFVDARETPIPPSYSSPTASATNTTILSPRRPGMSANGKSMEELQLENESLRSVLDEMSRRLWQFEMGAQMGGVALQQSIRASLNRTAAASEAIGPPVTTAASNAAAGNDTKGGGAMLESKLTNLEEDFNQAKKEIERMGRENEKLKGVVGRYRERWEKLKEGARTRRGGAPGAGAGAVGAALDPPPE